MRFLTTDVCFYFCAAFISFCCVAYYYSHRKKRKESGKIFELLIFNMLLTALSSIGATLMNPLVSTDGNIFNSVQQFFQTLYFALHVFLAPLFALYVATVNNWGESFPRNTVLWFLSPAFLLEIFILTNPVTHLIFYYQDNILFTRGPLELLIYGEAVGYIAFSIGQLFIFRRTLPRSASFALWFFIGMCVVGILIQFLWPWIKTELFFEAVSLLGLMLVIELDDFRGKPLEGVYDSENFLIDNERFLRLKKDYSVCFLEFSDFRSLYPFFDIERLEKVVLNVLGWILKNFTGSVYRLGQDRLALLAFVEKSEMDNFISEFLKNVSGQEFRFGEIPMPLHVNCAHIRLPDKKIRSASDFVKLGVDGNVSSSLEHLEIENALERSFQEKRFTVLYRPVLNLETQRFDSAEALLRFEDSRLSDIGPEEILSIAERKGFVNEFCRVIFESICDLLQKKRNRLPGLRQIDLNLSAIQLLSELCEPYFNGILKNYGIEAEAFNFDFFRSEALDRCKMAEENFRKMRAMGFRFSVGNFGEESVNLRRILRGEFYGVSLEPGRIRVKENDEVARGQVRALPELFRSLHVDVKQQGVSSETEFEECRRSGVTRILGDYISRPLEADELVSFIAKQNGEPNRFGE